MSGMKYGLQARCVELAAQVADLQQTFDLQWEADMRAVKLWREAHPGNELVLPDRANMVVWLLEQHDALAGREREALINAINSPTVAALARVFDPHHPHFYKSYSEQIVEILAPRLAAQPAYPLRGREIEDADDLEFLDLEHLDGSASPPEQPAAAPVTGKEAI